MKMELIFNELSLKPSVDNAQIANTLVEKLIKTEWAKSLRPWKKSLEDMWHPIGWSVELTGIDFGA